MYVSPSVNLSVCLFAYLSVCLFVFESVTLIIFQFLDSFSMFWIEILVFKQDLSNREEAGPTSPKEV